MGNNQFEPSHLFIAILGAGIVIMTIVAFLEYF